jgi:hypothetical protein
MGEDSGSGPEAPGEATPVRDRQCGRCRRVVPGDADLHPVAQLGWWLCPACREALVGQQPPGRS